MGERVSFIDPSSTHYDFNYPYAIKIGNDVTITPKVTILAHDYSYSVLNKVYGIMSTLHLTDIFPVLCRGSSGKESEMPGEVGGACETAV